MILRRVGVGAALRHNSARQRRIDGVPAIDAQRKKRLALATRVAYRPLGEPAVVSCVNNITPIASENITDDACSPKNCGFNAPPSAR
jgi:hypothetical protein